MSSEPVELGIEDLADAVEVGAGGFGTVYRARQESLHRDVAVKMVANTVKDRKVRIRFEREIQAMGMLSGHPNIVTVYDSGFTAGGQPYILMDFMEQGSLADRLEEEGTLPYADVCQLMVKVCGALETAHQAGVLHRDIKPENVLVSAYGEPKLGDFGIARLKGGPETGTSSLTASIEHVSPELLEAKAPGVPSDIYAMGSTMFKLLTGTAAFIRPDDESIVPALTRIRDEPVPNLRERGIPDPVAAVVERAMAKDPAQRYPSAAEMGRSIREVQRQIGLAATPLPIREEDAAIARETTRTIHSDDLAKSIEDIRAAARQPTDTGPGPQPAPPAYPPPHQTNPQQQLPPTQAPGPGPQPTGPQPAYPQPTYPQQQPYRQPVPPVSGGSTSSLPKVLAAVGALAVVVIIAVVVVLSMGGGDDPEPGPTDDLVSEDDATPTPTATPSAPPPPPSDPPPPPPYVYETLVDDSQTIRVQAPRPWNELETGPWIDDGTLIGQQIVASPDLAGFRGSWNVPGVIFGVSRQLAGSFDPNGLLDAIDFSSQCTYAGREDYADPAYTGRRDNYTDCSGTDTDYTIVAAWPPSQDVLLLVQFQAVEDRDDAALQQALDTFEIIPPPAPTPTDAGS